MSKVIGRSGAVGLGKESSRGTPVAATYWFPTDELMIEDRVKTIINETSVARIEGSIDEEVVQVFSEFSFGGVLTSDNIGMILLSLFGTDTPVVPGGETIVYEHTFTVAQSAQHQSLSVSYKDANSDVRIPNAVIGSLEISANALEWVKWKVEGMGLVSAGVSNTVAHVLKSPFHGKYCTMKKATLQSGLTGASATTIKAFNLKFNSNIITEDVLGSNAPADILNQAFTIEGSVTLYHTDNAFQTLQNAGTYQALRFSMQHPTTIGSAEKAELMIDLHRVIVKNREVKRANNDIMEESFDFTGLYFLTDSKMATVVLTNLIASY